MMEVAPVLVAAVLLVAPSITLVASEFCVCRSDQPTAVLQKAIDFSCGDGADCSAILQGGACYSPDTIASHCSWAANSYYQNNKATGATCDFDGAATVSTTDPSFSGCTFPSSASSAGMTAAGTTPAAAGGATTGTFSPGFGTAGANGTGVGSGSSLGPTGMGAGSFDAAAPGLLPCVQLAAFLAILSSFLVL